MKVTVELDIKGCINCPMSYEVAENADWCNLMNRKLDIDVITKYDKGCPIEDVALSIESIKNKSLRGSIHDKLVTKKLKIARSIALLEDLAGFM